MNHLYSLRMQERLSTWFRLPFHRPVMETRPVSGYAVSSTYSAAPMRYMEVFLIVRSLPFFKYFYVRCMRLIM